jgi:hypothetical protein
MSKRKITQRKKKPARALESTICIQFVQYLQTMLEFKQIPEIIPIHIPNEGKRSLAMNMLLTRMGMLSGCSDYLIIIPGGRLIAIEFKRDKTAKPTPNQLIFRATCIRMGVPHLFTWDIEEAYQFIQKQLNEYNS